MFAEDVELLPRNSFTGLLEHCLKDPDAFAPLVTELWSKMDEPNPEKRFYSGLRIYLRHFNGRLFHDAVAMPLGKELIRELLASARTRWTEVEPAIFGTLLEQALDPTERARLGAHYTPRAYVERLVNATIMVPLVSDWQRTLVQVEQAKEDGHVERALGMVREFHKKLCTIRVLDPSCGTGNFLYVAMELMKRLEGEILDVLASLGGVESDFQTVDPHQFLGLEINPRAVAIAELVLWIGYLQQHYKARPEHPREPILRAFGNIERKDAVLAWDGSGDLLATITSTPLSVFANPRRATWPDAEFIVGNPPFVGNKRMRDRLGNAYVEALRAAYEPVGESVDLVMYWWDQAATLLKQDGALRQFGLVTTNSITQNFNRRVLSDHIGEGKPLSLVLAVPNHPWTKASKDAAAVRISMTVAARGRHEGILQQVTAEEALDTDTPQLTIQESHGRINPDLSVGANARAAADLLANRGIAHQGVIPVGEGFRLTAKEVEDLGYDRDELPPVVRPYLIGRDLVQRPEERYIIDFYGLTELDARRGYPELFQIVLERVKPQRDQVNRQRTREKYWLYAEPRATMRAALPGGQYIATCRTAKHRIFSLVSGETLSDTQVIVIALDDTADLAILSSRIHVCWATRMGGRLGVGDDPRYNHSECFPTFPFPELDSDSRSRLRALGAELDSTRKRTQTLHPDLTLTALYNVVEKLRAGERLSPTEDDVKRRGLAVVLKRLHDDIDAEVLAAYGWTVATSDQEVLDGLLQLNAERAEEERRGVVRWLRPEHQLSRYALGPALDRGQVRTDIHVEQALLPLFPPRRIEQPLAVLEELTKAGAPLDPTSLARRFRSSARLEGRVREVLVTLAKYGRVRVGPDGRYAVRQAA